MRRLSAIDIELEADEAKTGSERSFGLVFAVAFAVFGAGPLLRGHEPQLWALLLAGGFLLTALIVPRLLRPLNLLWTRVGAILHAIVAPLVMGAVFFLAVVPVAMIVRLFGKDPLHLKFETFTSNWIKRQPSGPDPKSMTRQF